MPISAPNPNCAPSEKEVGALTTCPKCGATIQPHRACMACGFYKGKDVLNNNAKEETTNTEN